MFRVDAKVILSRMCLLLLCLTPLAYVSGDLQRPAVAEYVREVRYLVALFEFEDLNHTKSFEEMRSIAIDEVQAYFDQVSYGKVKVIGDILPGWRKLPLGVKHLDVFRWNFGRGAMEMIDNMALSQLGPLMEAREYGIKFIVYAGRVWPHAKSGVAAAFMNEYRSSDVYEHELGHVLGLPDLYSYKLAEQNKYSGVNVGPWDLMGGPYEPSGLCSWSLVKLEWVEKQQVTDVKVGSEGVFVIDTIANKSAKTIVVRIYSSTPIEAYYVEVRERLGPDARMDRRIRMGVLVLKVDERLDPREGGVVVIDSHPQSYSTRTPWAELYDAPFSVGRNETVAFLDRTKNLSVIVLRKVGYSYKVKVSDVASGEKAIEANEAIVKAEDAVEKARSENRLKGLEEAETQLEKAKAAYGEAKFKDSVDLAKLASESANAATKMPTTTATTITPTETATTTAPATPVVLPNVLVPAIIVIGVLVAAGAFIALTKRRKPVLPSATNNQF
jgi:predicted ATPase